MAKLDLLKGKTVVVTGASSGVGRATAIALAQHGANLVLAARREQALNEVANECEELGGKAMVVVTDVTDATAVKRLAQAAHEFGSKIDVWVNNAGVLAAGPFEETPIEIHDQVVQINLIGYMHGAHAVLPYFKRQRFGILINNISVGGWFPTPYAVGYTASKFGLRGFSEALKAELHGLPNIHVCDLYPAFLDTPGIQHAANYTGKYIKPAPPVYDPMKVAKAVVSLCLNPSSMKTVGAAAGFLKIAHSFFPALSRNITAKVMKTYLHQAEPTDITSGNLFETVEYGTGIHGGWNLQARPQQKQLIRALFLAGIAVGFLLIKKGMR